MQIKSCTERWSKSEYQVRRCGFRHGDAVTILLDGLTLSVVHELSNREAVASFQAFIFRADKSRPFTLDEYSMRLPVSFYKSNNIQYLIV